MFQLADDSNRQILLYLYRGEVLVASQFGQPLGQALILETEAQDVFELKSIAVVAWRQGQGIGGTLMKEVVRYCRMQKAKSLRVSTSIADANAIRFYLRHGFRASQIVRDAFTVENGYPKYTEDSRIPLNDAIEFELVLTTLAA
ncbi:GNAT family N-acetyltransferase [Sphingomonas sp. RB56-2]|uniref:GNAT family N-acetyltransferase n=1 Tax=Sphingomonas brevis TaxID=2908206 RepID=A0ABT0SAJ2_9SPHN|nr:GNAT family N-acetyltransferase [Sphingomonas brevis]MCL6741430.1 GNAT family N-acetyltransferase [Sphingomonas brevis]